MRWARGKASRQGGNRLRLGCLKIWSPKIWIPLYHIAKPSFPSYVPMAIGMRRMEEINHQHAPPLSKLQSTVSKFRMSLTDVTLKYSCCFSFNHNLALWISVFAKDLVPRWALLRVWSPRFIAGLSEEEVDFFRFLGGEGLQIRKPSQIEQGNKVNTGKNKGLYDYCKLL
jgi:hypothetical protein